MTTKSSSRFTDTILRRIQQLTARGWLIPASVIVVIITLWGIDRSVNPPEGTNTNVRRSTPASSTPATATSKPISPAIVDPATATFEPILAPCPSEALQRPASGAELAGQYHGGLGRVVITNGTVFDAVATLVDNSSETARRAIYIRQRESGSITSIPPGRYRLQFQLGTDWLTERRFCRLSGSSEFEDTFDYVEVKSNNGIKYSTHEVTLH